MPKTFFSRLISQTSLNAFNKPCHLDQHLVELPHWPHGLCPHSPPLCCMTFLIHVLTSLEFLDISQMLSFLAQRIPLVIQPCLIEVVLTPFGHTTSQPLATQHVSLEVRLTLLAAQSMQHALANTQPIFEHPLGLSLLR